MTIAMIRVCLGVAALCVTPSVYAWDWMTFDLPSGAKESKWRDELAVRLQGATEVKTKAGRADIVTTNEVFELDFQHKWKEGLGQVQAYAKELEKKPVLALISYGQGPERVQERSKQLFDLAGAHCQDKGVRLLVLFPTMPEESHRSSDDRASNRGETNGVTRVATLEPTWWISDSGVRHRTGCRWYKATTKGHFGGKDEGRPCKVCGG